MATYRLTDNNPRAAEMLRRAFIPQTPQLPLPKEATDSVDSDVVLQAINNLIRKRNAQESPTATDIVRESRSRMKSDDVTSSMLSTLALMAQHDMDIPIRSYNYTPYMPMNDYSSSALAKEIQGLEDVGYHLQSEEPDTDKSRKYTSDMKPETAQYLSELDSNHDRTEVLNTIGALLEKDRSLNKSMTDLDPLSLPDILSKDMANIGLDYDGDVAYARPHYSYYIKPDVADYIGAINHETDALDTLAILLETGHLYTAPLNTYESMSEKMHARLKELQKYESSKKQDRI